VIGTSRHGTTRYLDNLLSNDRVLTKSPAGANQWQPKDAADVAPDAQDPAKRHPLSWGNCRTIALLQ